MCLDAAETNLDVLEYGSIVTELLINLVVS